MDIREEAALMVLLEGDRKYPEVVRLVSEAGSALEVLDEPQTLFDDSDEQIDQAMAMIKEWRNRGLGFVTVLDADYPAQLREIQEAPPFLFFQGTLEANDRAVSVVGTRKPSTAGVAFAKEVARGLVNAEITVVSGLAAGIDTVAHTQAFEIGGRTVAVVGTGLDTTYPAENRALAHQIATYGGLILSQFRPEQPPTKWTFPARNAVMSGYGRVSVIVEASEHSGTRIQARVARAHGRPTILSEMVVQSTTWGAKWAESPGVYVAATPSEAVELAEELSRPLSDLLESLLQG